jgi:hypothetical protein
MIAYQVSYFRCSDPRAYALIQLWVLLSKDRCFTQIWNSHDQSTGCLSNPTTIDQSTSPQLIVATQWLERHCSKPRWYHIHPLQTPRKLNFQQLTLVGSSHTQQFLVWVWWRWRQRCSYLWECRKWLGRSHLSNRFRDNYCFVEGGISLPRNVFCSHPQSTKSSTNQISTLEYCVLSLVAYRTFKHLICPSNW